MINSWISVCPLIICLVLGLEEVAAKPSIYQSIGNQNDVDITEFPWQAAVVPTSGNGFLCGAAIISKTHLLTSADCIRYGNSGISHVTIGSSILEEGIKYQLKSNHTHPNYDGRYPFLYDIALLEIDGVIKFDETKSPVPLPLKEVPVPIGATVTLAGWGIGPEGTFSKHLRKQDLIINESKLCDFSKESPMGLGQLCAYPARNTTSCQELCGNNSHMEGNGIEIYCDTLVPNNDIIREVNKSSVQTYRLHFQGNMGTGVVYEGTLVGIALACTPCGVRLPEYVTRVYDYMDWIREVINDSNSIDVA